MDNRLLIVLAKIAAAFVQIAAFQKISGLTGAAANKLEIARAAFVYVLGGVKFYAIHCRRIVNFA